MQSTYSFSRSDIRLFGQLGIVVVILALAGCQRSTEPQAVPSEEAKPAQDAAVATDSNEVQGNDPKEDVPDVPANDVPANDVPANDVSANDVPAELDGVEISSGRELYVRNCSGCHGEQGDGNGIAAPYLFPKPRDFGAGRFRLVSTDNNVPSADDIEAVLIRGMPGSSMPPWPKLTKSERGLLVVEVQRLHREGSRRIYVEMLREEEELDEGEVFEIDEEDVTEFVHDRTTPGSPLDVPEIPVSTTESIERGKLVFVKQACNKCHGDTGKGDGQEVMVDSEGLPTRPRDLTLGIYKGGHDGASIYRRISFGMPGTPMPSSELEPHDVIDLIHFVRSLSDEKARQAAILNRERITVKYVSELPVALAADHWSNVEPVWVRMTPLWWRNDATPGLEVQALHDGRSIAIRLTWADDQGDLHAAKSESFEDAVAVELVRGGAEPFLGMGDAKSPVDVWMWDADRQHGLGVQDVNPRLVADIYPLSEKRVATAEYARPGTQPENQPDVSIPPRATANQITPGAETNAGSALATGGPGSVTFRLKTNQSVKAQGEWQQGHWTVVMTRPLAVADASGGISLQLGEPLSIAFAVWNGGQRDRDGQKLISIWQDLILEDASTESSN